MAGTYYTLTLHDDKGREYCIFYQLGRDNDINIKEILTKSWREIPQEQAFAYMPDLIQRIRDGWGNSQMIEKDYGNHDEPDEAF